MREKIIVGLMVLALLYFVYDYFLAAGPEESVTTQAHEAALAMVTEFQQELAAGRFDTPRRLAGDLADLQDSSWSRGAFVRRDYLSAAEETGEVESLAPADLQAAADELVYSGYLEMAGRRLAVINGQEYAVGDTVNDGLRLRRINARFLEVGRDGQAVRVPIAGLE